uniref:Uncharacterized protein n=1 Tax=Oryza rufipogon TaxID=4529 RepID=A0A0E0PL84_ORYRU
MAAAADRRLFAVAMALLVLVATTTGAAAARDVRPAAVERKTAAVMRHDVPSGPSPVHNGAPTPPAAADDPTVAVMERLVPTGSNRLHNMPSPLQGRTPTKTTVNKLR